MERARLRAGAGTLAERGSLGGAGERLRRAFVHVFLLRLRFEEDMAPLTVRLEGSAAKESGDGGFANGGHTQSRIGLAGRPTARRSASSHVSL